MRITKIIQSRLLFVLVVMVSLFPCGCDKTGNPVEPSEGNIAVTGVSLSPATQNLSAGKTASLSATILPANATNKLLSWESDDLQIANVSEKGLVTAIAAGSTRIIVRTADGDFSAHCEVTVTVSDTGSGTVSGTLGTDVTEVSNCISFIRGDRFTASGSYSGATYMTRRVPVTLAAGSDDRVEPVGEAWVFARLIMDDEWSLYYLLKGKNSSSDDFKYVYARGLNFIDDNSTFTKSLDGTLYGHLREIDIDNQISHKIGLRPDDEGYFFSLTPGTISGTDFASIDRAELTTSLGLNESGPNMNLQTEVDAQFTVQGYRYGKRNGELGLEISVKNTGSSPAQLLKRPMVFLMDGDDITLYHGSFTRFPDGGMVEPGETGGYFQVASDLRNASADGIMIILDFQDPARK